MDIIGFSQFYCFYQENLVSLMKVNGNQRVQQMKTRLTPDITIHEMVATRPQAADLIASIGMNPEQHTSDTIRTVCQQRQWNEVELIDWINKQLASGKNRTIGRNGENGTAGLNISRWSDRLIDEIHQNQVLLNEIRADFPRVHEIHGNQYTWL